MVDEGVVEGAGRSGGTGLLFFENLAQRRIIEVLGLQPGEEVFIPYLEVVLEKPKEQFACDLCKLAILGLIEQAAAVEPGQPLHQFVLNYRLTPMGRVVFKQLQTEERGFAS